VAPTPKADQLARQVEAALRQLDVALHEADSFDAARSQRRFVLHMSDIGADEFLPQLMAGIGRDAPGVRVEAVQLPAEAIAPALEEGRLDLAFGYLPTLAGTESAPILQERYVVLLRRGHPLAGRCATARRWTGWTSCSWPATPSRRVRCTCWGCSRASG
jgi:DNA-binding transcriptional LysR family regulator